MSLNLVPTPGRECEKSRDFLGYLQRQKLYQARSQILLMTLLPSENQAYAMILNDEGQKAKKLYQARSQILLMTLLPSKNQAYAMILNDEGQKAIITSSVGLLGTGPTQYEASTLYSKIASGYQRIKKDYNVQCDYCKLKGHAKENCYKLVGYPSNFKKKKGNSDGGQRGAYHVQVEQSSTVNQGQES
ncbi:hypothetical protein AABB24_028720 [Solanum stoloniferum]|uniref:Uncharacterized protein n=1 Tax=Solanum stoloniferum TaxID=62892 RepID=A0ABD2S8K8_9SOLN